MFELFGSLRGLVRVQVITIDNHVFRLHYQLTMAILLAFSILVTSAQLFRDPMDCHFPDSRFHSLTNYCYVQSTFLVERSVLRLPSQSLPYPGVSGHTEEDKLEFYNYYQWIFLALTVQAIFFYIPHYIWKAWEGGRMKMLAAEFASPVLSEDHIENNVEPLVNYFCTTLHTHNSYAYKYLTCEWLNLINIVGQIFFLNAFLGKDFAFYGIYAIMFQQKLRENLKNPMDRVFPTITQCSYSTYGPSGTIENKEGICVLPQNLINAKIYVFLWFWFHILAVISALVVTYRIVTLISSSVRLYVFRSSSEMNGAQDISAVFHKLKIGDWFLLRMLQKNINPQAYKELIFRLAQRFGSGVKNVYNDFV